MQNDKGKISFATGIDNSQLQADAQRARDILHGIGDTAKQEGAGIDSAMKKIAAAAAGVFAAQKLKNFAQQVANVRGEFQQLEMAFETMLGSADKADALMSQLITTAATTPFGMTDVANGAKQLLAYGVDADDVNETLIRLGDIAAGLSIPLNDLAYLYGTTMVQGRMYTQDLNQFLGRGIPLTDELAKQFGVAKDEVKKLVEEGKVGFPEVKEAIRSLTDEGGKFGGLMKAQSQTITGQISNIEDSIEQMFNELGKKSEGFISGVLSVTSTIVDNWENIGKTLLVVISTYGAYKAAVIAAAAAHKIASIWGEVQAFLSLTKSVTSAKDAMLLLNMATKANPIGLILGVVAAAATAFGLFSSKTGEASQMSERFGSAAATTISRLNTLTDTLIGLRAKVDGLNISSETQKKVTEDVNEILGEYGLALIKEGDTIDEINKKRAQAIELIKLEGIEKQRANALDQGQQDYEKSLADARSQLLEDLQGAATGEIVGGVAFTTKNNELRENASAISTIIGNLVEQQISTIAGKTGKEYEDGLNKIYKQINERMRAIGISEKTINEVWTDNGFFKEEFILGKYIAAVQEAAETHGKYTTAVNKSADADRQAAEASMTFSEKVSATEARLKGASNDVHELYKNIKQLMSQYSKNTIGFTIEFSGEIPKWMSAMKLDELQRLAARFSAIGKEAAEKGWKGTKVNGKYYTTQELLQRGADYSRAAEEKQNANDAAEKNKEDAGKARKEAERERKRRAEDVKREQQQIARETAERTQRLKDSAEVIKQAQREAELDIRQEEINLMQDGVDKELAQIELNYQRLENANIQRRNEMLEKIRDIKELEWENANPKAKKEGKTFDRSSIGDDYISQANIDNLRAAGNEAEAKQLENMLHQLQEYDRIAGQIRDKGNREVLEKMLADVLTYQQQREKIEKEYADKRANLYSTDKDGNKTLRNGVTQGNLDELQLQETKALEAVDEQFAEREETYQSWCSQIASITLDELTKVLQEAQTQLDALEKSGNADPQQLAVARAKVAKAQEELNKRNANKNTNLSPGKRSVKEWEDLYKTLSEVEKEFEDLGKTVGGTLGDIISICGSFATSSLSMINGIMTLAQWSTRATELAAQGASKAIQQVEKASVILTIISAALQIAMQIANLFNNDAQKQKEIEALQNRIDQLQWELDNADTLRWQREYGSAIVIVNKALGEARTAIAANSRGWGKLVAQTARASKNASVMADTVDRIAKAYANMSYTADKALGADKFSGAIDKLRNIAQQQVLINEQIELEASKKDKDSDKIADWKQKIEELGQDALDIINEMIEDIIGDTSSGIAEELANAFFDAFEAGEDAAKAWGDKVNEIVADVLKRMMISKFLEEPLGKVFDKYKSKWFKDGEFMGIDNVVKSMQSFGDDLNNVGTNWIAIWNALPDTLKETMKNASQSAREGASEGIAQASQDSVDELNGRATAIQSHTYSISENTKLLLNNTNSILQSVMHIESETDGMSARLARIETQTKAMGDTLDDIALRGIKLKN